LPAGGEFRLELLAIFSDSAALDEVFDNRDYVFI
jgi:hypothetical protein